MIFRAGGSTGAPRGKCAPRRACRLHWPIRGDYLKLYIVDMRSSHMPVSSDFVVESA